MLSRIFTGRIMDSKGCKSFFMRTMKTLIRLRVCAVWSVILGRTYQKVCFHTFRPICLFTLFGKYPVRRAGSYEPVSLVYSFTLSYSHIHISLLPTFFYIHFIWIYRHPYTFLHIFFYNNFKFNHFYPHTHTISQSIPIFPALTPHIVIFIISTLYLLILPLFRCLQTIS